MYNAYINTIKPIQRSIGQQNCAKLQRLSDYQIPYLHNLTLASTHVGLHSETIQY